MSQLASARIVSNRKTNQGRGDPGRRQTGRPVTRATTGAKVDAPVIAVPAVPGKQRRGATTNTAFDDLIEEIVRLLARRAAPELLDNDKGGENDVQ